LGRKLELPRVLNDSTFLVEKKNPTQSHFEEEPE